MRHKKSLEELQASTTKYTETVRAVSGALNTLMVVGGVAFCAYELANVLISWGGKSTTANVLVNIITDLKANQWFAYVFGGGCLVYGLGERRLRRLNIKRMSKHSNDLEKMIDPNKASSGLNPRGETRNHDR